VCFARSEVEVLSLRDFLVGDVWVVCYRVEWNDEMQVALCDLRSLEVRWGPPQVHPKAFTDGAGRSERLSTGEQISNSFNKFAS
jgi:hypothetical protein